MPKSTAVASPRRRKDDRYWRLYKSRINLHVPLTSLFTLPKCAPSKIQRTSPVAFLGVLEVLPTELLCQILENLDFKSLGQVRRTCLRGKELVESLPCVKYMHQVDKKVLFVMRSTQILLSNFPAPMLVSALGPGACLICRKTRKYHFVNVDTCTRECTHCWRNVYYNPCGMIVTCAQPDFPNDHSWMIFRVGVEYAKKPSSAEDRLPPIPPARYLSWFVWGSSKSTKPLKAVPEGDVRFLSPTPTPSIWPSGIKPPVRRPETTPVSRVVALVVGGEKRGGFRFRRACLARESLPVSFVPSKFQAMNTHRKAG